MNILPSHSHIEACRDPDDNKFIECAIDNRCIYIVSGDKDLLVLEQYEDIGILTVSEFLEQYEKKRHKNSTKNWQSTFFSYHFDKKSDKSKQKNHFARITAFYQVSKIILHDFLYFLWHIVNQKAMF